MDMIISPLKLWFSAWVKPSEIQNLSTEIDRKARLGTTVEAEERRQGPRASMNK